MIFFISIPTQAGKPKIECDTLYSAVHCASDGIDRFAYQTTAIGLRRDSGGNYRIHAPFGVARVLAGRIVPNPVLPVRSVYEAKVARWQKIWPDLEVAPWPDGTINHDDR